MPGLGQRGHDTELQARVEWRQQLGQSPLPPPGLPAAYAAAPANAAAGGRCIALQFSSRSRSDDNMANSMAMGQPAFSEQLPVFGELLPPPAPPADFFRARTPSNVMLQEPLIG